MWETDRILSLIRTGDIRKALFVGPSRVGDILFNTPALRHFKQKYPEISIHYLSSTYAWKTLQYNPHVDGILHYDRKAPRPWRWLERWKMQKEVKSQAFDFAFFFNTNPKIVKPVLKTGIPYHYPSKPGQIPEFPPDSHSVERAMRMMAPLAIEGPPGPMEIFWSQREEERVDAFLQKNQIGPKERFALVHPGCFQIRSHPFSRVSARRLWPLESFQKLATLFDQTLGLKVILSASGKGEIKLVRKIGQGLPSSVILAEDLDILELACLLKKASLAVTVDTGPMHIAAALETPLVAIFGPTPVHLTSPWGKGEKRVLQKDLPCSPCRGKGIRCYNNRCMKEITPEEVFKAAEEMLVVSSKK